MREARAASIACPSDAPAEPRLERKGAREALGPVEEIAQAYLATTHGDAGIALRCAITDALSDLLEAERRARENSRLISRGYVRDWSGRG